ncbi:uncharacterized protein LOC129726961 [Wyeomyia smithii]|uniref:uncharacterized protein LOC129726961 n=1 Tax=Wyeomyia smithii TaxID=174621 RepID=UPI002468171D|nr:uncharacterized protein LOC129726961 [Wyeomyia smithii]
MDVYYMSDSIQYGSFRNPLYRDYEKFPYGTLENPLNNPPKSSQHLQQQQRNGAYSVAQEKTKSKSAKESCPFCKEQKKRPLGAYMRKRDQRITSESISEDAEECHQEEEEQGSGTETSPAGSPSNTELASHNHYHHGQVHRNVVSGRYTRQESQESDGK